MQTPRLQSGLSTQAGMTVIEIGVIIVVVGLILAVVALPFATFRQRQSLQNSTNAVVAALNEARTKTLASVGNTYYSVRVESSQVVVFSGSSYISGAASNGVIAIESPVTATWSLQGGGSVVSFDRLKGTTSQYGTITLSLPNGSTKTVTISALGTILRN